MSLSHVRRWHDWQRAGIKAVVKSRVSRAKKAKEEGKDAPRIDAPYSMSYVCVAAAWDRDLVALSRAGLGTKADTYLLRVLQHVGQQDALRGEMHVPRNLFGPQVLSTVWDPVSARAGGKAYDIFFAARFLVEGPSPLPNWLRNEFPNGDGNESHTENGT